MRINAIVYLNQVVHGNIINVFEELNDFFKKLYNIYVYNQMYLQLQLLKLLLIFYTSFQKKNRVLLKCKI